MDYEKGFICTSSAHRGVVCSSYKCGGYDYYMFWWSIHLRHKSKLKLFQLDHKSETKLLLWRQNTYFALLTLSTLQRGGGGREGEGRKGEGTRERRKVERGREGERKGGTEGKMERSRERKRMTERWKTGRKEWQQEREEGTMYKEEEE